MIALLLHSQAAALAAALLAPGEVSTPRNEYNYTVARTGQVVVFARSEPEFANAKILIGRAGDPPELIGFSDPRYSDTDPQISADGRILWFVSNRPTEAGGAPRDLNIWRSNHVDGRWSAPEPVARANGPGVELGPEVHDGVLTFNSTRRGGPGGLDIWSMDLETDAAPEVLPEPINSRFNEGDFTLSRNGRVALFWSDRPGGAGAGDIWMSERQGDGWADPVNLGPTVNGGGFDFTPSLSPDEKTLYFASTRRGSGPEQQAADIYTLPVSAVPVLARALGAPANTDRRSELR